MPSRPNGYAICIENRGAADLDLCKVYRVLPDKDAATAGYLRVIDESGEDYLYPAHYFVAVDLPPKAKRAWTAAATRRLPRRARSSTRPLQRATARLVRPVR